MYSACSITSHFPRSLCLVILGAIRSCLSFCKPSAFLKSWRVLGLRSIFSRSPEGRCAMEINL
jgi:hypothetical protein